MCLSGIQVGLGKRCGVSSRGFNRNGDSLEVECRQHVKTLRIKIVDSRPKQ